MLCAYLTRSVGLVSLLIKSCGVSDSAGAAIMAAVAENTTLKTLDLSRNDIGGTSDLLASHSQHHQHEQGNVISSQGRIFKGSMVDLKSHHFLDPAGIAGPETHRSSETYSKRFWFFLS